MHNDNAQLVDAQLSLSRLRHHVLNTPKFADIKVVYDIGSHGGHWSRGFQQLLLSKASGVGSVRFELFDGNRELNSMKVDFGEHTHCVVLGEKDDEQKCWYKDKWAPQTTGNSLYKEQALPWDRIETETVQIVTLDTYVSAHHLPLPHYMKLDTQGSELDILRGFKKTLLANPQVCRFIQLEVNIHTAYNQGAPLIAECIQFMKDELAFDVMDILSVNYGPGNTLAQTDFLFYNTRC